MKVYKKLCKDGYAALKCNVVRIGSLKYYSEIEDEDRRDKDEGVPKILMRSYSKGRVVSSKDFNTYSEASGSPIRIANDNLKLRFKGKGNFEFKSGMNFFVYCTTIVDDDLSMEATNHLGTHAVHIASPKKFKDMIADRLLNKLRCDAIKLEGACDSISSAMRDVLYQDKIPVDDEGKVLDFSKSPMDVGNAFVKPVSYRLEAEYRFIWLPFHNTTGTACMLPYGFKFIDLEVPGIWACLQDVR